MPVDRQSKIEQEKEMISYMIDYYCRRQHNERVLCKDCQALLLYAHQRIDKCPFMEIKTFCSNCKVHCYRKDMREKIRDVMRYAGPRMLFHKPIMALRHVYYKRKERT